MFSQYCIVQWHTNREGIPQTPLREETKTFSYLTSCNYRRLIYMYMYTYGMAWLHVRTRVTFSHRINQLHYI